MSDDRPTWQLVLEAAGELGGHDGSSFRLGDVVAAVQRRDATRARPSIQPVVQGMTANAGRGPLSPCRKTFIRTAHGQYALLDGSHGGFATPQSSESRPAKQGSRVRLLSEDELTNRVTTVTEHFDDLVQACDDAVPFLRTGQYERHRETVDRRQELGSVAAAIGDETFTKLLRETLGLWGIGKRRSKLVSLAELRATLEDHADEIVALERVSLEAGDLDVPALSAAVSSLVWDMNVVTNRTRIVAGTKTLHHLLPDAVPPMDGAWTGSFFVWKAFDTGNHQHALLDEAFRCFAKIAVGAKPSRLVGEGWRTSPTKLLDNAVIAFCKARGIGGTEA